MGSITLFVPLKKKAVFFVQLLYRAYLFHLHAYSTWCPDKRWCMNTSPEQTNADMFRANEYVRGLSVGPKSARQALSGFTVSGRPIVSYMHLQMYLLAKAINHVLKGSSDFTLKVL